MTWWHYLLLVNFYLVLFFGFYVLLLRTETFFQLNRVYLVAASLLSFLIPLIQANWVQNLFITQQVQQTIYNMPVGIVYNFTVKPTVDTGITLGQVINALYITVTLFLIIRLGWQLLVLKKAIEKPSPSAAYSFFKKISLGENIAPSSVIAEHEQVHAGQWHSVDVMIIETVMIINWFNPVVYLYRFAIKYIHEFIADRQVIQAGTDKVDYAMLLLSQTFQVETHSLVTPFYNHSLLKKRIMMLHKNKSQRLALAKYGLSAPLFILMMIFSSATVNNSKAIAAINKKTTNVLLTPAADVVTIINNSSEIPAENKPVESKTNYIQIAENIDHEINVDTLPKSTAIFSQVEKQPQFPGGISGFGHYLADNIKYPAADKESKTEGRVIASFVVERDGALSDVRAIRGPSETLKAEAIRVLLRSPRWIPGVQNGHAVRVTYTVPIQFTIPGPPDGKIKSWVHKEPQFPGGLENLGKFLAANIRYPQKDRENNVSGKVFCTFIVETDGTLTDIKAVRSPSDAMAKEAVRVLLLSPKWTPGLQDNAFVRTSYTLPISFNLSTEPNGDDKVYNMVDKQPGFPGGLEAFSKYLSNTIRYPKEDRENGTSGRVICSFIVEADGTLTGVKAVRSPSETMAKEAVRVMMGSPKWTPGIKDGHAVRVTFTVPISFNLSREPNGDDDSKVYNRVDKGPVFPGGMEGFSNFLSKTIVYPKEDREAGRFGRVICQFIVEADGTLTNIKSVRAPSETMAKEAVRVLTRSPKWTPGIKDGKAVRVSYTVPIAYVLEESNEDKLRRAKADSIVKAAQKKTNLLYVIDGVQKKPGTFTLRDIKQEDIAGIEVLTDKTATALYGSAGKNGVIKITTTKAKKATTKP